MRLEAGASPVEDILALGGEFLAFGQGFGVEGVELRGEHCFQRMPGVGVELDGGVVRGDELFGAFYEDRAHGAFGALGVATSAHEVGVDDASLVPGVADHHAAAADPAVQAAFEVVLVSAAAVSG
nr:hypothetical protein [Cellulomonas flavigena]